MKSGGPQGLKPFPGILFAQAAKPSAKGVHLTPYVFLPAHHLRRDESVFVHRSFETAGSVPVSFFLDAP